MAGASILKPTEACAHIFGKSKNSRRLDNDTEDSLPHVYVWTISRQMIMAVNYIEWQRTLIFGPFDWINSKSINAEGQEIPQ